jgi:PAS domain S-box-containing protein
MMDNENSNQAAQVLLSDLVENILRYSDNPGACATHVTAQIRELIGVRMVALVANETGKGHNLVGICPPRKEEYWNQPELQQFITSWLEYDTPRLIDSNIDPAGNTLSSIGISISFVIPLMVGAEKVGMLVLLDLLDQKGVSIILETLTRVSRILALILKNSFLYRDLEHTVEIRTGQLARSEQLFRALFEQAIDGIFFLDAAGKVISVNESFARLHGRTVEEMTRMGLEELDVEGTAPVSERMRRIMAGESLTFEVEHVHRDGHIFPLEVTTNLISVGNEKMIIAVHRDITERKKAAEQLQRKQAMLARTEGIAHIGSWEWDVATDTVTWSDELFQIFRRDPEKGAPSFAEHPEIYYPEDMAKLRQAVEAAVSTGKPYEMELRAIRTDGETRVCLARGNAEMGPGGNATRLFGSLQDITDRKRAEEDIRKLNEELEQRVKDRTAEIEKKNTELERMNKLFVGRELRMIELKGKIATLEEKTNKGNMQS